MGGRSLCAPYLARCLLPPDVSIRPRSCDAVMGARYAGLVRSLEPAFSLTARSGRIYRSHASPLAARLWELQMHLDSCPRHKVRPNGLSRSMGRAISTCLPTVVTLMLLPTIAFATPPDPWWIAGIYDGGDSDDIVTLVYETSSSNAAALSHMPPLPRLTEASFVSIVHRLLSAQFTGNPRAPPTIVSSRLFKFSPDDTPTTSPSSGLVPAHRSSSPICPDGA